MIASGSVVSPKYRATNDGRPRAMAVAQVVRKVGTVENLYELRSIETGTLFKCMVFPEDVIRKPYLEVVK